MLGVAGAIARMTVAVEIEAGLIYRHGTLRGVRDWVVDARERHVATTLLCLALGLVGAVVWRWMAEALGIALVCGAGVGWILTVAEGERQRRREIEAEQIAVEDERRAVREVVRLARGILLETPLYLDAEARHAAADDARMHGASARPAPSWSVNAIRARGFDENLRKASAAHLAQGLRTAVEQLRNVAASYAPRLSLDALRAFEDIGKAAERAADDAEYIDTARTAALDTRQRSPEEMRERLEQVEDARKAFLAALENVVGSIDALMRYADPGPA